MLSFTTTDVCGMEQDGSPVVLGLPILRAITDHSDPSDTPSIAVATRISDFKDIDKVSTPPIEITSVWKGFPVPLTGDRTTVGLIRISGKIRNSFFPYLLLIYKTEQTRNPRD